MVDSISVSIALLISVIVISLLSATFFVTKDAKRFASAPPTPLIDMDRMYDVVFNNLDEETGSRVTPAELASVLHGILKVMSDNDLIHDTLKDSQAKIVEDVKLDTEHVSKKLKEYLPDLDVDYDDLETLVSQTFSYLQEIGAIVTEV